MVYTYYTNVKVPTTNTNYIYMRNTYIVFLLGVDHMERSSIKQNSNSCRNARVKIRKLILWLEALGVRLGNGHWYWICMIVFIRLSRLVSNRLRINKNREDGRFLFIRRRFETKRLSWIKKIINIHYHCSLPNPTLSASSHRINFQFSDFDTYCTVCTCNCMPCTQ